MAIEHINEVFSGATITSFNLTIPSGSLASCPLPATGDPTEIIFGLLETLYQGVVAGSPTYISTNASSSLVDSTTYRRSYSFSVDLAFDGATVLETLDVKAEPVE